MWWPICKRKILCVCWALATESYGDQRGAYAWSCPKGWPYVSLQDHLPGATTVCWPWWSWIPCFGSEAVAISASQWHGHLTWFSHFLSWNPKNFQPSPIQFWENHPIASGSSIAGRGLPGSIGQLGQTVWVLEPFSIGLSRTSCSWKLGAFVANHTLWCLNWENILTWFCGTKKNIFGSE